MLDDFFPGIDLRWDDNGVSGWIKRNAADLVHWCVIVVVSAFVAWTVFELFYGVPPQPQPEAVPQSVPDTYGFQPRSGAAARQQPPWWYNALLDAIKTITPIVLPFISNFARKKFKTEDDEK